jgi:HAE1 family hydrophobic/amphiphilic exporter-1
MKHDEGMGLEESALESARLRFRPILMTAFAFILGVVPLMRASGAGAGAQNVMGTGVFWGMLVATAIGVFLIPGNFVFVLSLFAGKKKASNPSKTQAMITAVAGGHGGPTPAPSAEEDEKTVAKEHPAGGAH